MESLIRRRKYTSSKKKKVVVWLMMLIMAIYLLIINYPSDDMVLISLQSTNEVLVNPYVGWVLDARDRVENPQTKFSLVYAGMSWRTIEPQKGIYDFEEFEKQCNFDYWRQNGIKIIIRLYMDYPQADRHLDIPDWLYDETGGDGEYYDIEYGRGFSPNYSNAKIIDYHKKLIQALAKRYDNMSEVAFIEIGSIGHWGELHTKIEDNIPFPTLEKFNLYIEPYTNSFLNKKLLIRRPFQIAKDNEMGLFNDSFGDILQTEDYFLSWVKKGYTDTMTSDSQPSMADFWKNSPSGGEVANYPGTEYFENDRINRTLEQLKNSHISWLGPSSPYSMENSDDVVRNMEKVQLNMGYRFYASSVKTKTQIDQGKQLPIIVNIKNIGNAPFYYKWPVEIFLLNSPEKEVVARVTSNYDITQLMPGESARISEKLYISENIPDGEYSLCYGITNPDSNKQDVKFANRELEYNNKYSICKIQVGSVTSTN